MKVFLCEKPDQAKSIANVLANGKARRMNGYFDCGNNTLVTFAIGHLLTTAEPDAYVEELKSFGHIEALPVIPDKWKMGVLPKTKDQFNNVRAQIKKATEVVIASDAGREGELIGREIVEYCQFRGKLSRIWLQALNKASITKALNEIMPAEKKFNLYMAALARQRADWLVGMNLSRIMTAAYGDKTQYGKAGVISVGRIQTPTLGIIVARDLAIDSFVVKGYFNLSAQFKHLNGVIQANYVMPEAIVDPQGYCIDKKLLEQVARKISGVDGNIIESVTEPGKTWAPLPYDLLALQQDVSKRLKISAKQVLDIAQVLYEKHKLTTYPRVDSRYLEESMFSDVPAIMKSLVAIDPSVAEIIGRINPELKGRAWNTAKVEESDHHAMMPLAVDESFDLSILSKNERTVYQMIRDRFLMQFCEAHEFNTTKITIDCVDERFVATGKVDKYLGWKGIFAVEDDEEKPKKGQEAPQKLPDVKADDAVQEVGSEITNGKTKPPARFTEATLLAAMANVGSLVEDPKMKQILGSKGGLGTPATRAAVIERLIEIQGIERQGQKLISTTKGKMVIAKLPAVLTTPETTAIWEMALDQIEKGKVTYEAFMSQQEDFVRRLVEFGKGVSKQRTLEAKA
jgi:DNA topoisomerase-3